MLYVLVTFRAPTLMTSFGLFITNSIIILSLSVAPPV